MGGKYLINLIRCFDQSMAHLYSQLHIDMSSCLYHPYTARCYSQLLNNHLHSHYSELLNNTENVCSIKPNRKTLYSTGCTCIHCCGYFCFRSLTYMYEFTRNSKEVYLPDLLGLVASE